MAIYEPNFRKTGITCLLNYPHFQMKGIFVCICKLHTFQANEQVDF